MPIRPENSSHASNRKAVVIGATGGTGRFLVRDMLERKAWTEVTCIGRSAFEPKNLGLEITAENLKKLKNIVIPNLETGLDHQDCLSAFNNADSLFVALGVPIERPKLMEAAEVIIPMKSFQIAKNTGIKYVAIITSQGNHKPDSGLPITRHHYAKEKAAEESGFHNLTIARPGILNRQTCEPKCATLFRPFGFKVEKMARVMVLDAERANLEEKTETIRYSMKDLKKGFMEMK